MPFDFAQAEHISKTELIACLYLWSPWLIQKYFSVVRVNIKICLSCFDV